MTSFFRNYSPGTLWRSLALLAALIFTFWVSTPLPAVAQIVAQTTSNPTTAAPAPVGLTVTGWNQSSGIGRGYNVGGDGKGVVNTLADGFFRLTSESFLTGNSNPACVADCRSTQAKLGIIGEQITGARATNQGVGTLQNPVSSVAGTNGAFSASLQTQWRYTPPPSAAPAAP